MILKFLNKKRKKDGTGDSVETIAKGTGLEVAPVSFVLKTSLLYEKCVEWVEFRGVDYFRAVPSH